MTDDQPDDLTGDQPDDQTDQRTQRTSDATREADRRDAQTPGGPDRPPTAEEEELAEGKRLDPTVAEHEREMIERGATQQGEGRIA